MVRYLYSGQSGTRSKTQSFGRKLLTDSMLLSPSVSCWSTFLSTISYHLDSVSLLNLRGFSTRLPLGVALSLSVFAFLLGGQSVRLHHVQTKCNMVFLCFFTLDSLTQGQSPECVKSPAGLLLRETNPAILCISSSEGVVRGKTKKINFLLIRILIILS